MLYCSATGVSDVKNMVCKPFYVISEIAYGTNNDDGDDDDDDDDDSHILCFK